MLSDGSDWHTQLHICPAGTSIYLNNDVNNCDLETLRCLQTITNRYGRPAFVRHTFRRFPSLRVLDLLEINESRFAEKIKMPPIPVI